MNRLLLASTLLLTLELSAQDLVSTHGPDPAASIQDTIVTPEFAPADLGEQAPSPIREERLSDHSVDADTLGATVRRSANAFGGALVTTAFRIPAPLSETPRAVSVVDADRMRDQNRRDATDILRAVPGVFTNGSNSDASYHVKMRGYHMPPNVWLVDGLPGVRTANDFSPTLFGIENVVFLRGPASLHYGPNTMPGGLILLQTKRPLTTPHHRVDLTLGPWGGESRGWGSAGTYILDLDATGPVNGFDRVFHRIVASTSEIASPFADQVNSFRQAQASLLWRIVSDGSWQLRTLAQWERVRRAAGNSRVVSPTSSLSLQDGSEYIDLEGMPWGEVNLSAGGRTDHQATLGLDLEGSLAEGMRMGASWRWLSYDTRINDFVPVAASLTATDSSDPRTFTILRQQRTSEVERFSQGILLHASWDFALTPSVSNLLAAGAVVRWHGLDKSSHALGPRQSPINVLTGVTSSSLRDSALNLVPSVLTSTLDWSLWLQDQVALLDRRIILTGAVTLAGQSNERDYRRTSILRDTVSNLSALLENRESGLTPLFGVLVKPLPGLSIYATRSSSFALEGIDSYYGAAGQPPQDRYGAIIRVRPQRGTNLEVGGRWDPTSTLSASLTVFRVTQENILVESDVADLNPNGVRWFRYSDGEGRVGEGVESSLDSRPLPGFDMSLSGAWMNTRARSTTDSIVDGSPTEKTPRWSATLFGRYVVQSGSLTGWGAGAEIDWQTSRLMAIRRADAPDPARMPWSTRVDGFVSWSSRQGHEVALMVTNLFDERIVENGTTGRAFDLGTPRTASLRLSTHF